MPSSFAEGVTGLVNAKSSLMKETLNINIRYSIYYWPSSILARSINSSLINTVHLASLHLASNLPIALLSTQRQFQLQATLFSDSTNTQLAYCAFIPPAPCIYPPPPCRASQSSRASESRLSRHQSSPNPQKFLYSTANSHQCLRPTSFHQCQMN